MTRDHTSKVGQALNDRLNSFQCSPMKGAKIASKKMRRQLVPRAPVTTPAKTTAARTALEIEGCLDKESKKCEKVSFKPSTCTALPDVLNDDILSFKVPKGHKCTLYSNLGCSGRSMTRDHNSQVREALANKISSFRCLSSDAKATTTAPGKGAQHVSGCIDAGFTKCKAVSFVPDQCTPFPEILTNDISSFKVPKDHKCTLYSRPGCSGKSMTRDHTSKVGQALNDKLNSFQCSPMGSKTSAKKARRRLTPGY
ncbi:hypothetical protein C8J56DRAFT_941069 [Mycena floridula]|nr:hypothetical protein C8J56DRAFT_941069 [Mycena floridula]